MGKRIRILTSSDVHGVLFPYEYAKGRGRNWGLAKLSGLIRSLRGPDTILIDNGDTLEGSPLSFYHYAKCPPLESPMTAAMAMMRYDFVNLERYGDAANIDVNKDYYNWDHLNVYGSEKVTDYIANMLQTKYGITKTELTEKQTAEWNDSVNYYHMIYNYCQEMIKRRLELGKTGNGGTTVSEDEKSISTIERYARNHPDAGKYDVILDDEKDS